MRQQLKLRSRPRPRIPPEEEEIKKHILHLKLSRETFRLLSRYGLEFSGDRPPLRAATVAQELLEKMVPELLQKLKGK
jgi:hypothetical protein